MPSTKDFDKKHGHKKSASTNHTDNHSNGHSHKRRPGRDEEVLASEAEVKVVDVETEATEQAQPTIEEKPKVEINFTGSEILRAQFPKMFAVFEKVASDWVQNGNFDGLPIQNPLAQTAAQKGLQKAKEIETKVLASPVTEKVATQVLTAGMKAQSLVNEFKGKIKRK
jgi:hypothetical protein